MISPALAERLLFLPDRSDPGPPPPIGPVRGERVELMASDGVRIFAWWYGLGGGGDSREPVWSPGANGRGRPPHEAPVVLLLHGNAGHVGDRVPLAQGLIERGLSVLLVEYRGYGGNTGRPSEQGVHLDAVAGLDFAAERSGSSRRVCLFGRSVGAAVAASLAATHDVGSLILEATFTSLDELAHAVYPVLPRFLLGRLSGHFDVLRAVDGIDVPMLVIHGTADRLVPISMGLTVASAARGPAEWFPVEGAGHNDVFWVGGAPYFDRIARFVRRALEQWES